MNTLFEYIIRLGDDSLILGHRLSEWCGHGPVLEQDIAMTNIALDLVGQARSFLQYAGEVEGKGRDEDDLAYLRREQEYKNVLLVERPNIDFAYTVVRQLFFSTYSYFFYQKLKNSTDSQLAAIAEKSLKEVTYHLRWSSEWTIRLGDGTAVSHEKIQTALDDLWEWSGELFEMNKVDDEMIKQGIGVDLKQVKELWDKRIDAVLTEATLTKPTSTWMQKGGRQGRHTEHLGFILTELQFLQRAYPGAKW